MQPRIAAFEVVEAWEREYLARAIPGAALVALGEPLSAQCAERGVMVTNVPRYGENTVAEHTFGLILNLSHKLHLAYLRTRRGNFSLDGLEGMDLRGRTIGVIGAGRIGLHVVRIARAFDMTVLVHDVQPQSILEDVMGFSYVSLERLLADADIVTLHAPLLAETRDLMNRDRFGAMKRGSLFVNTSRGGLVNTEALLWALDTGILAGAALDVLEGEEHLNEESYMFRAHGSAQIIERMVQAHRLLERENVLFTPHIAWFSREARTRILATTAANLDAFLAGRSPPDLVGT
jgi:D-lactate dehydrogenase